MIYRLLPSSSFLQKINKNGLIYHLHFLLSCSLALFCCQARLDVFSPSILSVPGTSCTRTCTYYGHFAEPRSQTTCTVNTHVVDAFVVPLLRKSVYGFYIQKLY